MDPYFRRILVTGLSFAFLWGALVALASKVEIRRALPDKPWISII